MVKCIFVSDLHGNIDRYKKLFRVISTEKPKAVFIGGDILPLEYLMRRSIDITHQDFVNNFLAVELRNLKKLLKDDYPRIFLIMGNDDARFEEISIIDLANEGLWEYVHNRHLTFGKYVVFGYAYIPPTPFMLKDWERYDVSRYLDPGCISPEEGRYSVPVSYNEKKYATIQDDLEKLTEHHNLENAIFLFHSPPYKSELDRAALDGEMVSNIQLDVHVGSIAIKNFIVNHQPFLTLHGHVHESARLTGKWKQKFGRTFSFSAAYDGQELAVVKFDLDCLETAERVLV